MLYQKLKIADAISATGGWFFWSGGKASFEITATTWNGATATLQKQANVDGSTAISVDTTNLQATANKVYCGATLPAGYYKISISGSPTAVTAYLESNRDSF